MNLEIFSINKRIYQNTIIPIITAQVKFFCSKNLFFANIICECCRSHRHFLLTNRNNLMKVTYSFTPPSRTATASSIPPRLSQHFFCCNKTTLLRNRNFFLAQEQKLSSITVSISTRLEPVQSTLKGKQKGVEKESWRGGGRERKKARARAHRYNIITFGPRARLADPANLIKYFRWLNVCCSVEAIYFFNLCNEFNLSSGVTFNSHSEYKV